MYRAIEPPFTAPVREMQRKDLARFFQWFMSIIPGRVEELSGLVKSTPGFEFCLPNCDPDSLDTLGKRFADQIETIDPTKPIDEPGNKFTSRTYSLTMDVGIYLSQVLISNYPMLRWVQPLKHKKFIDYGQPVLAHFGRTVLNPPRTVLGLAYGLARKTGDGTDLRRTYNYWSRLNLVRDSGITARPL